MVTASSLAGKRRIGVGTAWPGPAWWEFFDEAHPPDQIMMARQSILV